MRGQIHSRQIAICVQAVVVDRCYRNGIHIDPDSSTSTISRADRGRAVAMVCVYFGGTLPPFSTWKCIVSDQRFGLIRRQN
jgi:hypothetical protein